MSHQFEDPENSHDSNEADDFAGFADDLYILQLVEENCQEKRDYGEKVHQVHGLNKTSNVEKVN